MNQPSKTLIHIKDLNKYYGQGSARNHVLKGVDISIQQGEFLAIVGTSGSGKTTLLNILGALDRSYQGTVEIAGHNLQQLNDRRLSQLRNETIGFIFQSFNLLPHLSCAQNVLIPSFFNPNNDNNILARARQLLADVGLEEKFADRPTELSGGQRQRVCIARALFNHPHLILCDEPTGSLDRETGQQIINLFRSLNRDQHITFIIVTHDENLSQTCDRIIRLADGQVVEDQPPTPLPEKTPLSQQDAPLRPALHGLSLSVLSSPTALLLPSWLPDACESPLALHADNGLSLRSDGHTLRWDNAAIDLDRPFSCHLTYSDVTSLLLHLTLRQQSPVEDPADPLKISVSWQELTLSAPCSRPPHALEGLPCRAESYPLTPEDDFRNLIAALRAAMHRQGVDERWF